MSAGGVGGAKLETMFNLDGQMRGKWRRKSDVRTIARPSRACSSVCSTAKLEWSAIWFFALAQKLELAQRTAAESAVAPLRRGQREGRGARDADARMQRALSPRLRQVLGFNFSFPLTHGCGHPSDVLPSSRWGPAPACERMRPGEWIRYTAPRPPVPPSDANRLPGVELFGPVADLFLPLVYCYS